MWYWRDIRDHIAPAMRSLPAILLWGGVAFCVDAEVVYTGMVFSEYYFIIGRKFTRHCYVKRNGYRVGAVFRPQ